MACSPMLLHNVPRLDGRTCSAAELLDVYSRAQVVLLEHAHDATSAEYGLGHLRELFTRHEDVVAQGWTAERVDTPSPEDLLGGLGRRSGDHVGRWYASVVLDERRAPRALAALLAATPRAPRALASMQAKPHVWLFFGSNGAVAPMPGRPEHRDNVQSDGTWHVQLSGSKEWRLRPYPDPSEWKSCAPPDVPSGRLRVIVEAGAALLVNTRLYLHETSIPGSQPGPDALSMSLARDFSITGARKPASTHGAVATDETEEAVVQGQEFSSVLCNVELCAWCGTPCSRDALGVCGCLCCTMRRGRRGGGSVARHSDGEGVGPRGALYGTAVPRGLTTLRPFGLSTFCAEKRRRERTMPWQTSFPQLVQIDKRDCFRLVQQSRPRDDNAGLLLTLGRDGDATEVMRIKVVQERSASQHETQHKARVHTGLCIRP